MASKPLYVDLYIGDSNGGSMITVEEVLPSMANLVFKGLPTSPEQREYIKRFGFHFCPSNGKPGPYAVERWEHSSHTEDDVYMFYIRWDGHGKPEFFPYGQSRDIVHIKWTLFPEMAEHDFGIGIYHMVMGFERHLGFNLNKFTGTEIVECLRQLAKTRNS